MKRSGHSQPPHPGRRRVLQQAASLGALAAVAPYGLSSAQAQGDDLGPYRAAKINWRQCEGEQISAAVIPATGAATSNSCRRSIPLMTGSSVLIEASNPPRKNSPSG